MKNNLLQLATCILLVVLATLLLNPFHFWMPDMLHMAVLAGLLVLFGAFAAFVLREQATDEREVWMRMLSSRIGYLAGVAVLVVAIAIEGVQGSVDPWLVAALVVTLIGKFATYFYLDR